MSSKDRTHCSPAHPAHAAGRTALALLAGLLIAGIQVSRAGTLSEAAKEALKPVEKQHPVPVGNPQPAVVAPAATIVICSPPPEPPPPWDPTYPEPHPNPYYGLP